MTLTELHDRWTVHHVDGEYTIDGHLCWPTREEAQAEVDGWPDTGAGYFVVRRPRPCHTYTCGCGRRLVDIYANPHFPTPDALHEEAESQEWTRRSDGVLVCPDHPEET